MSIDIGHIQQAKNNAPSKIFEGDQIWNKSFSFSKGLSDKKKVFIYKDLAILLKAGIDFKTALTIIRDQQKNNITRQIIEELLTNVVKGKALYESMQLSGKFTPYEIFSVKIGEETRMLDVILVELQNYFQRKEKLKKQIISILTYPAFIMVLTFGTLYFMLTYVVPLFESVFNQFNKELPKLTKIIIYLSENFNTYFISFIAIFIFIIIVFQTVKEKEGFKKISTGILLKIPFFGKLIKEIYLTRFCQSMALLLVSKTSIIESLSLVRKMIGFYPLEKALEEAEKDIKKGMTFGDSISKFKIFDSNAVSMVKVAEQVNQLDDMFLTLASHYDQEVEHKTKVMGSIIEPLMILLIGGIVGVIMISMYAPMFDLSKVLGGN